MIPIIDLEALCDSSHQGHAAAQKRLGQGVGKTGFLIVENTGISVQEIDHVFAAYSDFFKQPIGIKERVNMACTGANRGWGAAHSEQVDPNANPDYKEVFDCGFELSSNDPIHSEGLSCYAPNLWPDQPKEFAQTIGQYYAHALSAAQKLLREIAGLIGKDCDYFAGQFTRPMALLRGNYYPPRPAWAGDNDFGIAAHTDYGCLTLLATDGTSGLEVQAGDGSWHGVIAPKGSFVINFGEMLEVWSAGKLRATPHRVIGMAHERMSIPMFVNPNHDTNIAPAGSGQELRAIDHLAKRYKETYVHLQGAKD